MNKNNKNFFAFVLFSSLAYTSIAVAAPLQVVFEGCEPVEVISHDDSCGTGGDPKNTACRDKNGPVRWAPVGSIGSVTTKEGSPGELHNCKAHPNQGYYQCIIRGKSKDRVAYNVTSVDGCTLDPVIIIN